MLFRAVRGMKDLFDTDWEKYHYIVEQAIKLGKQHGYKIIETPILEYTDVFQRSIGDETDVVSKEMYTFIDRGEESVTLRPEGTAGVIRAVITNNLVQNLPIKLMYHGPMFRYDRPQKGRYRQFHQIGFEHIGDKSPYADALAISLAFNILSSLGIIDFKICINTLGDDETKKSYGKAIVKFFSRHKEDLSEDSQRRLEKNPLRILDSKDNKDREICSMAPLMTDYLNKESGNYFDKVCDLLKQFGIPYELDNFLVRGLDYYSHTAFEILSLKSSGAICGGGRYDKLVQEFGGPDVSGIGFAFGAERVMNLLGNSVIPSQKCKFAVIPISDNECDIALQVLRELHNSALSAEFIHNGTISKKMKIAYRLMCDIALIIGETEKNNQTITVKFMRDNNDKGKMITIDLSMLSSFAKYYISKSISK